MKFWKEVLRPGKYLVTAEDGTRKVEEFTPDRLTAQAATHNAMRAAGLLIPVPWSHAEWDTPVTEADKKALKTKHNAGFTEEARISPTGSLEILHDIPLQADVDKIGATVREVSPYIRKSWTDGTGKVWTDAILHSALVTNPIMPGQTNFRAAEDSLAIAMSHYLPEGFDYVKAFSMSGVYGATPQTGAVPPPTTVSSADPSIDDVLVALKGVGLVLPSDTTDDSLKSAIIIAATAIKGANGAADDDESLKPGERTTQPPAGVALSHTQDQAMSDNKKLDSAVAHASNLQKKGYRERILGLIHAGVTTKAFADSKLSPQVEAFAMSFADDGSVIPSALDTLLESLEAAAEEKKANSGKKPDGSALAHGERIATPPSYADPNTPDDDDQLAAARKQGEAHRDKLLRQRGLQPIA